MFIDNRPFVILESPNGKKFGVARLNGLVGDSPLFVVVSNPTLTIEAACELCEKLNNKILTHCRLSWD